jgi:hypothetical protein
MLDWELCSHDWDEETQGAFIGPKLLIPRTDHKTVDADEMMSCAASYEEGGQMGMGGGDQEFPVIFEDWEQCAERCPGDCDCSGACWIDQACMEVAGRACEDVISMFLADGNCDDEKAAFNLNCDAYDYDAGDCQPSYGEEGGEDEALYSYGGAEKNYDDEEGGYPSEEAGEDYALEEEGQQQLGTGGGGQGGGQEEGEGGGEDGQQQLGAGEGVQGGENQGGGGGGEDYEEEGDDYEEEGEEGGDYEEEGGDSEEEGDDYSRRLDDYDEEDPDDYEEYPEDDEEQNPYPQGPQGQDDGEDGYTYGDYGGGSDQYAGYSGGGGAATPDWYVTSTHPPPCPPAP